MWYGIIRHSTLFLANTVCLTQLRHRISLRVFWSFAKGGDTNGMAA